MMILFTRSESILSVLIRGVTKEPVSHCALESNEYVIHMNLLGLQIEHIDEFRRSNEIMYSVDLVDNPISLLETMCKAGRMGYDYGALLYLGLRYLFPFLPKKNLWQSSNLYLCTEWVEESINMDQDAMITPYGLYKRLMDKQQENK